MTERYGSATLSLIALKVSNWLGPPCSQSKTTVLLLADMKSFCASAISEKGNAFKPSPKLPILRKSRLLNMKSIISLSVLRLTKC